MFCHNQTTCGRSRLFLLKRCWLAKSYPEQLKNISIWSFSRQNSDQLPYIVKWYHKVKLLLFKKRKYCFSVCFSSTQDSIHGFFLNYYFMNKSSLVQKHFKAKLKYISNPRWTQQTSKCVSLMDPFVSVLGLNRHFFLRFRQCGFACCAVAAESVTLLQSLQGIHSQTHTSATGSHVALCHLQSSCPTNVDFIFFPMTKHVSPPHHHRPPPPPTNPSLYFSLFSLLVKTHRCKEVNTRVNPARCPMILFAV